MYLKNTLTLLLLVGFFSKATASYYSSDPNFANLSTDFFYAIEGTEVVRLDKFMNAEPIGVTVCETCLIGVSPVGELYVINVDEGFVDRMDPETKETSRVVDWEWGNETYVGNRMPVDFQGDTIRIPGFEINLQNQVLTKNNEGFFSGNIDGGINIDEVSFDPVLLKKVFIKTDYWSGGSQSYLIKEDEETDFPSSDGVQLDRRFLGIFYDQSGQLYGYGMNTGDGENLYVINQKTGISTLVNSQFKYRSITGNANFENNGVISRINSFDFGLRKVGSEPVSLAFELINNSGETVVFSGFDDANDSSLEISDNSGENILVGDTLKAIIEFYPSELNELSLYKKYKFVLQGNIIEDSVSISARSFDFTNIETENIWKLYSNDNHNLFLGKLDEEFEQQEFINLNEAIGDVAITQEGGLYGLSAGKVYRIDQRSGGTELAFVLGEEVSNSTTQNHYLSITFTSESSGYAIKRSAARSGGTGWSYSQRVVSFDLNTQEVTSSNNLNYFQGLSALTFDPSIISFYAFGRAEESSAGVIKVISENGELLKEIEYPESIYPKGFFVTESAIPYLYDHSGVLYEMDVFEGEFTQVGEVLGAISLVSKLPEFGSTPNFDNVVTSTNEDLFANLSIYPNPASGEVLLRGLPNNLIDIDIVGLDGKVHKLSNNNEGFDRIDISNLKKGLYLFRFWAENGLLAKKKFIKH
ncbi:T9SS type A sorting domain-containing protein [Roseivirga pacifica]